MRPPLFLFFLVVRELFGLAWKARTLGWHRAEFALLRVGYSLDRVYKRLIGARAITWPVY